MSKEVIFLEEKCDLIELKMVSRFELDMYRAIVFQENEKIFADL